MSSLNLKLIVINNYIGISIDKEYGNRSCPLTPYYFWPISNTWEQIKIKLNSKPWITAEERIRILNAVSKILEQPSEYLARTRLCNIREKELE
jgi:30S ribosomal protein 3